jgi:hypothetical protein
VAGGGGNRVVRVADHAAVGLAGAGGRPFADEELDAARDVVARGQVDGVVGELDAGEGLGLGAGRAGREAVREERGVELLVGDEGEGGVAEGDVGVAVVGDPEARREVAGAVLEARGADLEEVGGELLDRGRVGVRLQAAP